MPSKAADVFEVIRASAKARRTITYKEVGEQTDLSPFFQVPRYLGEIWRWCEARGIPHLNAIVVNQDTRLPGSGYTPHGSQVEWSEHQRIKVQVFNYDWDSVRFP